MMFTAFNNQTQSLSLDNLTLENRLDHVSVYGNINITKDKAGLENAKLLHALFAQMVQTLQQDALLPDHITLAQTKIVNNPFK